MLAIFNIYTPSRIALLYSSAPWTGRLRYIDRWRRWL